MSATIIYDLRDGDKIDEIEEGNYTVDGVTLTMMSPQGELNQTGSSFGVNHEANSDDAADLIDGDAGAETFVFSFSEAGRLTGLTFSEIGGDDTLVLTPFGESGIAVDNSDTFDIAFDAGEEFSLAHNTGNGVSLNAISITSVPEPSSSGLLIVAACGLVFRRKRLRKS